MTASHPINEAYLRSLWNRARIARDMHLTPAAERYEEAARKVDAILHPQEATDLIEYAARTDGVA